MSRILGIIDIYVVFTITNRLSESIVYKLYNSLSNREGMALNGGGIKLKYEKYLNRVNIYS